MRESTPSSCPVRGRYRYHRAAALLGAVLCVAGAASSADAVTINTNFVASGGSLGRYTAGSASTDTAGGGSLSVLMGQAAHYWEHAITDAGTLNVNYGWSSLGSGTLGSTTTSFSPTHRPTSADIAVTDASSVPWFMDSTPGGNSEYGTYTTSSHDYGGGTINTGRVYTGATGAARNRFDMLTVAIHELGHALGFYGASNPLDISNPLPDAGTQLPTDTTTNNACSSNCDHLAIATAAMYPSIPAGERKLLTSADRLGVAQLRSDSSVNLSAVPLPASGLLMISGLAALLRWGGLRRRAA